MAVTHEDVCVELQATRKAVEQVIKVSIEKEQRLEQLEQKTSQLENEAQQYGKQTAKTRRTMQLRLWRQRLLFALLAAALFGILVLFLLPTSATQRVEVVSAEHLSNGSHVDDASAPIAGGLQS
ncbi:MAG: hypothetical protein MHM6MM_007459 [Cercozoa sp. M6MM]